MKRFLSLVLAFTTIFLIVLTAASCEQNQKPISDSSVRDEQSSSTSLENQNPVESLSTSLENQNPVESLSTSLEDQNPVEKLPWLVDVEIINGKLILFYSDGTTKNSDISIDSTEAQDDEKKVPISASCLNFYPLNDTAYGVLMEKNAYQGVQNNPYLQEVTIPGTYNGAVVTTILEKAFFQLESLKTVIIQDGIVEIDNYAFKDSGVSQVTLPDSLKTIGSGAFDGCPLTKITIPNSVTKIMSSAFRNCQELSSVTYQGSKSEWAKIADEYSFGKADGYPYSYSCTIHCTDGDIVINP